MLRNIQCKLLFIAVLLLSSCGGGGGGGSEGSDVVPRTGVRVLHGALDASPLDINSNLSARSAEGYSFASASQFLSLETGFDVFSLTRSRIGGPLIFNLNREIVSGDRLAVLVFGNNENLGLRANIIESSIPELEEGFSAVRIIHSLVGAADITGVVESAGSFPDTTFGEASNYIVVPSGDIVANVSRVVDRRLIFSGAFTLSQRKAYTILVTGEVDFLVLAPLYPDS